MSARERWPRLTQTLRGPKHPSLCQSCGAENSITDGIASHVWEECDDYDVPDGLYLVLCAACSERLIDKHPRLYHPVPTNKPIPGLLAFCDECTMRQCLACTHPDLKANGGRGLAISGPTPQAIFMDGTKGGRRAGWVQQWYSGPARRCAGFTPVDTPEARALAERMASEPMVPRLLHNPDRQQIRRGR